MSTEKPITDALAVSVILNRKDQPEQPFWTEWRDQVVLRGGTPAQAGAIAALGAGGQFDPSVIPGGSGGGSSVSVDGTLVTDPNFNATTPAAPGGSANVTWQFDGAGNVSAYVNLAADMSGTFRLDDGTFIVPASDFSFDDGSFV